MGRETTSYDTAGRPARPGRLCSPREVLIVEDDALLALDATLILEAGGFEVIGLAADTAQACALSGRMHPSLAVVDLNLADGRTGSAIATSLAGAGWAVVMATGQPNDIAPGTPALRILQKPYRPEALLNAVRDAAAHLAGRRTVPIG